MDILVLLSIISVLINVVLIMAMISIYSEYAFYKKYSIYLYQSNIETKGTKKEYDIYCKNCGEKVATCMSIDKFCHNPIYKK